MKHAPDNWWERAVFYELYVDKFAGNFQGLRKRLGYLEDLGITCIHILPHYPSPMIDDGYDISDYFDVRPGLGTLKDFENFAKDARTRGIDIMLDFVLNHTSTKHPWFREARSNKKTPRRDFYIWSATGKELQESINSFPSIKPSVWITNAPLGDFYFSTFYPEQADLNWRNPEVFSEMMKVLHFWTEFGVRGFRLDAASHLIKKEGTNSKSLPETHQLLKQIRNYTNSNWKDTAFLAEVNETPEKSIEYFGDGDECQLVYNFPLAGELFLAVFRGDERGIHKLASKSSGLPDKCRWMAFLRSHDELALSMLMPDDREELLRAIDPEKRFLFGNGASVRLATAFKNDQEKIKKAFSLLFEISRKISARPIIYYGDEIGMQNEKISKDEKDTRKSVRGSFNWNEAKKQQKNPDSLFSTITRKLNMTRI